jgi:SAM-dependent methyltransferase
MNFLRLDPVATDRAASVDSSGDSIAAYDAIAEEYDDPQHRTTAELGRLSRIAVCEAPVDAAFGRVHPLIVELGCGTGAFTVNLARRMQGGQLVITDPSLRMLRQAVRNVASATAEGPRVSSLALCASAVEVLQSLATPPDLIAAGLADPYLSEALLRDARRISTTDTHMLVTVPTRRWAVAERAGRLDIPLQQTRFRTRNGGVVHSRSVALEPGELAEWLSASGFRAIAHGAIESHEESWDPRPEIAWALGRPAVSATATMRY